MNRPRDRRRARTLSTGVLIALALGIGGCGSTRTAVTGGTSARLKIANYAFHPPALTVRAGTTIIVANTDSTSHTATARSGAFDSGTLKPGQSARLTLNAPGVYTYYCQFHAFMTATVKVIR